MIYTNNDIFFFFFWQFIAIYAFYAIRVHMFFTRTPLNKVMFTKYQLSTSSTAEEAPIACVE